MTFNCTKNYFFFKLIEFWKMTFIWIKLSKRYIATAGCFFNFISMVIYWFYWFIDFKIWTKKPRKRILCVYFVSNLTFILKKTSSIFLYLYQSSIYSIDNVILKLSRQAIFARQRFTIHSAPLYLDQDGSFTLPKMRRCENLSFFINKLRCIFYSWTICFSSAI